MDTAGFTPHLLLFLHKINLQNLSLVFSVLGNSKPSSGEFGFGKSLSGFVYKLSKAQVVTLMIILMFFGLIPHIFILDCY